MYYREDTHTNTKFYSEDLKGRPLGMWEDTLKLILKKLGVRVWSGFILLKTGPSVKLL
jgi:hypothetical protein